ncbi:phage tail protein [Marininema halotolerans]|uniref:Phage-related protein n=1 Tax=Marininema halotolerans TaxID=1155944 RepID=A0A1I6SGF9_9BACL|nr:hypothetical protein [Marininema halotolerans]SFS75910.1 hypothetical protein SAMN05444972_10761 [Marininema halotolerans]
MAEQIPQIDLKPIEKSLNDLDKKLLEINNISKKFENNLITQKNREEGAKEIGTVSLMIYGAVVLGLWTLVQDDAAVKASLEGLSDALSSLGSSVAPVFATLIDILTSVVNAFNSLPEPAKQFILVGFLIMGVLFGILGAIIPVIASIAAMSAATGTFAAAALPVVATIALIVLALAGLIAGLIYAYNHFEGFRNLVNAVWTSIQEGLAAVWAVIQPALIAIADFFIAQWQKVVDWWNTMLPTFMAVWNAIWTFIQPIVAAIVSYIQMGFQTLLVILTGIWEVIQAVLVAAWEVIKAVISAAINIILSIISFFVYLFTGQWGKMWESALNILKSIGGMLTSIVGAIVNMIVKIIGSLIVMVANIFKNIWQGALNITSDLLGGISSKISSFCKGARDWGVNMIEQFVAGIRSGITWVTDAVNDVVNSVKDFLGFSSPTKKGPGSQSNKWAPNFMEMFTAGIKMGMPALKSVASQSASQLAILGQSQGSGGLALAGGGAASSPTIQIDQMHVRNDQDIRLISQELWRLHQRQARSFGGRA